MGHWIHIFVLVSGLMGAWVRPCLAETAVQVNYCPETGMTGKADIAACRIEWRYAGKGKGSGGKWSATRDHVECIVACPLVLRAMEPNLGQLEKFCGGTGSYDPMQSNCVLPDDNVKTNASGSTGYLSCKRRGVDCSSESAESVCSELPDEVVAERCEYLATRMVLPIAENDPNYAYAVACCNPPKRDVAKEQPVCPTGLSWNGCEPGTEAHFRGYTGICCPSSSSEWNYFAHCTEAPPRCDRLKVQQEPTPTPEPSVNPDEAPKIQLPL